MKTVLGKHSKHLVAKGAKRKVVLNLALETTPKFKGFKHTVAEGLKLAHRCYTELPEFALKK